MIRIDFSWAISIYTFLMISLVIGHWVFYTFLKDKDVFDDTKFFQECPYCTHIFFSYEENGLKMCPKCQSYITEIRKNNSGLVLVSVLAISIAMIVVAIGVLNSNVSLTLSGQRQVDRIKADQIAKGQFWRNHSSLLTTGAAAGPWNVTLTESHRDRNGVMRTYSKNFCASTADEGISSASGLNGARQYDITSGEGQTTDGGWTKLPKGNFGEIILLC